MDPVIAAEFDSQLVDLLQLLFSGKPHQGESCCVLARFIAVLDTAMESPLAQISMIPMLAWIARNAPAHLKATFFAVMASFTNLALSASSLGTKYLNEIYTVTREVKDLATGAIEVAADYGELGWLLITVAVLTLALPLATILVVQLSPLRTQQ